MVDRNPDWPMWAAAVWCEAFEQGSWKHIMSLKFLQAPDKDSARGGAVKMMCADYPKGTDFQALVSVVPSHPQPGETRGEK